MMAQVQWEIPPIKMMINAREASAWRPSSNWRRIGRNDAIQAEKSQEKLLSSLRSIRAMWQPRVIARHHVARVTTWTKAASTAETKGERSREDTCMTSCKARPTRDGLAVADFTAERVARRTHPCGQRPQRQCVWGVSVRRRPGKIKDKKKARPSTASAFSLCFWFVLLRSATDGNGTVQRSGQAGGQLGKTCRTIWYIMGI